MKVTLSGFRTGGWCRRYQPNVSTCFCIAVAEIIIQQPNTRSEKNKDHFFSELPISISFRVSQYRVDTMTTWFQPPLKSKCFFRMQRLPLSPLATTSKKYKHVFEVIDAFSNFTWLYPTRYTDAEEAINRLENQRHVFGSPARIITVKGSEFTSSAFEDYCNKQNILHISITTGLPRYNSQIEKQNSTIIVVLTKLSVDDPEKRYSHVPHLQEILRSTFQRSIKMTPVELLFGTKMKSCQDVEIVQLLNDEITTQFQQQRDARRQDAKKQIYKVQNRNRRTYNLRRIQAHKYKLHDLVANKRTQIGLDLKRKQKYLEPYKVTKVTHNDTYDLEKCDFFDVLLKTCTCAEFMILWPNQINST
ncbi:hypothetical protein TNCV_4746301 [Trichonephila clavipes]|nr:hypothetical protein TNCV_4746301 [Trichonephila clavipes]